MLKGLELTNPEANEDDIDKGEKKKLHHCFHFSNSCSRSESGTISLTSGKKFDMKVIDLFALGTLTTDRTKLYQRFYAFIEMWFLGDTYVLDK